MDKLTEQQQEFVAETFVNHGKLIKQIARKFANGDSRYDESDIESYLNERFVVIALKYDPSKSTNGIGAYLNAVLTKHAINYTNSAEANAIKATVPFSFFDENVENDNQEDYTTFEETLTDGDSLESTYHRNTHIKNVMDELFAKANELQTKIMRTYLTLDKPSFTQIGKLVGVHHTQVQREFSKLSKLTDFDITVLLDGQA